MAVTKIDLASQATGTMPAASLPNPSASTLGGIQSTTGTSHQWISSISTSGVPGLSQPAFADISGTLTSGQMPTFTGDVTNSGLAMTVVKINGVSLAGLATGLLKNTTTTGVPSIAVAGTDYLLPTGSAAGLSVATSGAFGVVKVDGTTITATAGVISASLGVSFADNEVPTGTINGSNASFTLAHAPANTSLSLFLNGILQKAGAGNDYTISTLTITMLNVPVTGDVLLANYRF